MNIIDEVFYIKEFIKHFYPYLYVNETLFQANIILISCSSCVYFIFDPSIEEFHIQDESYRGDGTKDITLEYQTFKRKHKISFIFNKT